MSKEDFRIGLFGIGLDTYWPQFSGLEARLNGYLREVHANIAAMHPHVINAGLVDSTDKAFDAGKLFKREDVSIIFLYVSTYALSSTVLPVVQRAGVPVIILNLAPEASIDYENFNNMQDRTSMTREWLAYLFCMPGS